MNKIDGAIHEIHRMGDIAQRDQWVNEIHPLGKLIVTALYIAIVVSFDKYDVWGLFGMIIYPIALMSLADLSFIEAMKRLRIILPLVCFIGIFNPFFDKTPVVLFGITTTAGVISMITLMAKGFFTVTASYIFIATTTIEKICYALQQLHLPDILVTQILFTYRYITLFLEEVGRVTQAYSLRAPKQKGIHFKVWGSLTGQILLRSMDRAEVVYESMLLRGYCGSFDYLHKQIKMKNNDIFYVLLWSAVFIVCRKFPIVILIGSLAGRIE